MIFQESQPVKIRHVCLSSASACSLKIMDAPLPARKAHAHEIHEKAGSISNTCELPLPVLPIRVLENHLLRGTRIDRKFSARDVLSRRCTTASLFQLRITKHFLHRF